MAVLAVQKVPVLGLAPSFAAATSGGDKAPCGPRRVLVVRNGSGASIDVTATTPGTTEGIAIADPVLTVAAGLSGFFPLDSVYRGTDGNASIAYTAVTTVTVVVVQLP
ncbi:MAG: hypothetical protein ACRDRO_27830 [Pseudonocardiaceae bacterium]